METTTPTTATVSADVAVRFDVHEIAAPVEWFPGPAATAPTAVDPTGNRSKPHNVERAWVAVAGVAVPVTVDAPAESMHKQTVVPIETTAL
jgi:hypothetical protein